MKIAIIMGTRPEIIKMSPIIRECKRIGLNFIVIHTGQHYSEELDRVFFRDLKLEPPAYNLKIGSHSHAKQTALILDRIEPILIGENITTVLVEGDTNTVLAGALAASKMGIKVGHVEAGLRSYDRTMPEEINRILTDHISSYCFCPTEKSANILINEGIDKESIFVTGNTIVDAVMQNRKIAEKKSEILHRYSLKRKKYIVATIHRPSTTDSPEALKDILSSLGRICKEHNLPIIFPIHPRTKKSMSRLKLSASEGVIITPPLRYLDFLKLLGNAALALTDSGGIQEEACILGVPCVTLRYNTERPESIEIGSNILAGTRPEKILKAVEKMMQKKSYWKNPFGDGNAAERIIKILNQR